jgi:hypothetical protein
MSNTPSDLKAGIFRRMALLDQTEKRFCYFPMVTLQFLAINKSNFEGCSGLNLTCDKTNSRVMKEMDTYRQLENLR